MFIRRNGLAPIILWELLPPRGGTHPHLNWSIPTISKNISINWNHSFSFSQKKARVLEILRPVEAELASLEPENSISLWNREPDFQRIGVLREVVKPWVTMYVDPITPKLSTRSRTRRTFNELSDGKYKVWRMRINCNSFENHIK